MKNGETKLIKEGKWWKFCHKFSDGSGTFYSEGFEDKALAERSMHEHETRTGEYAWRTD